jgi:hypothetical protein
MNEPREIPDSWIDSKRTYVLAGDYLARTIDLIRKSQEAIRRSDELLKRTCPISGDER